MTTQSFANPFRPYNPFIASVEEPTIMELDEVDATGDVSYALVQSGPAVAADEVESHLDAVEVKVTWGKQTLAVKHLTSGKGFSVGEGGDFVLPTEAMKSDIVSYRAGMTIVSIPASATATVFARGEAPRAVSGGDEIDLRDGMRISIAVEPVTIDVAAVRAGKRFKVGFLASLATGAAAAIGLSFVGHTAIVASLAFFMPKMGADDAENIGRDQMLMMQTMMNTSADREADKAKEESASNDDTGGGATGGEPHKGEAGAAGTQTAPKTQTGHMAFKGNDDKVQLSRAEEKSLASEFGMIGMMKAGINPTGLNSAWGADSQLGQDRDNKLGSMFGQNADDAFGYGLGVSGIGEGGGGNGAGVGIDGVGNTVGGGGGGPGKWGYGKGDKDGIGNSHGLTTGQHVAKAPPGLREAHLDVNGRLAPEVIQRIVRMNNGRFRQCYENGLRTNPTLSGRVTTKFVIGRDGAVQMAADGGSDLPNQEVVSCVVRSFQNLSFPKPEGGVATVVYPIVLTPSE